MTHHNDSHDRTGEDSLEARIQRFLRTAEEMGGSEEHRRDRLVEHAEDRGVDRPTAEQAYDLAREEHLEPAYGLALVVEGVSVRPLASPSPDVETSEPNEPEWVDAPPGPELAERERRLRQTFRRLRSHLEQEDGIAGAAAALTREPDVEAYRY